jgi:hypothetical protein
VVTTQTLTIAEFLRARIAERKAAATYEPVDLSPWVAHGEGVDALLLAECEAHRRIVEAHPSYGGYGEHCATCYAESDLSGDDWPCVTLRALASVYADHEDFREEWRV